MKVEVLISINSGMYNKGDIVDLPDKQARRLLESGQANKVGMAKKPTPPKEPKKIIQKKPKTKKE